MSRKKPYFKVRNYFESVKLVTNSILCSLFPACILSIGHPLSVTNSFFLKKRRRRHYMSRKKPYFKVRNYFESVKLVTNSILCSLFPACILSICHPLSVTNSFFLKKKKEDNITCPERSHILRLGIILSQ